MYVLLPSSRTSHVHFLSCSSVVTQEELELRRSWRTDYKTSEVRGYRHLRGGDGQKGEWHYSIDVAIVVYENQCHSLYTMGVTMFVCPYCVSGEDLFMLCEETFSCVTCT